MNTNQVKGVAKDAAGKVQRTVGEMTGSTTQQAKGLAKQAEGKAQKAVGDLQETVDQVHDERRTERASREARDRDLRDDGTTHRS